MKRAYHCARCGCDPLQCECGEDLRASEDLVHAAVQKARLSGNPAFRAAFVAMLHDINEALLVAKRNEKLLDDARLRSVIERLKEVQDLVNELRKDAS